MDIDASAVRKLIKALTGYEATDDDGFLIELAIEDRTNYVLSVCNRDDIPARLKPQLLKMIVGEFLYQKKSVGGSESLGMDPGALVSSITEDDETVSFAVSGEQSGEAALDAYINRLRRGNPVALAEFRRLKWPKRRRR